MLKCGKVTKGLSVINLGYFLQKKKKKEFVFIVALTDFCIYA